MFRFPKRAERVVWQAREDEILVLAARALDGLVPEVRYRGEPGEEFPYPFRGYRRLPGEPAESSPHPPRAAELAATLGRLHSLEVTGIPPTPAAWENETLDDERTELIELAPAVRSRLGGELRDVAEPYLAGQLPAPPSCPEPCFCHNDISGDHLLVAEGGRLTGLIDWADAMATDPVVDFAGLITVGGWSYIEAVVAGYPLMLDAAFRERLRWLARTLTLRWVADAVASGEADLSQQLGWADRAFEPAR